MNYSFIPITINKYFIICTEVYLIVGRVQSRLYIYKLFELLWFVSSLGLLAGAMGSTVENEEKIRRITYSYRQYHRYKEAQQEEKEKKRTTITRCITT